ncbi:MAG: TadE/TadG family type IV pilus assembly protein [Bacillota bacterium]
MLKNNKGQAMIEMAIILPILLLLILGIFDFGRILYSQILLENNARYAARVGIVKNSDSEIMQAINESSSGLDSSRLNIVIDPSQSSRSSGDSLRVKLDYDVEIFTPLMSNIIGNPVNISGEATMRVE